MFRTIEAQRPTLSIKFCNPLNSCRQAPVQALCPSLSINSIKLFVHVSCLIRRAGPAPFIGSALFITDLPLSWRTSTGTCLRPGCAWLEMPAFPIPLYRAFFPVKPLLPIRLPAKWPAHWKNDWEHPCRMVIWTRASCFRWTASILPLPFVSLSTALDATSVSFATKLVQRLSHLFYSI